MIRSKWFSLCVVCLLGALMTPVINAQSLPSLDKIQLGGSELRDAIRLYSEDERSLRNQFEFDFLPLYRQAQMLLCQNWQKALLGTKFEPLSAPARMDYILFEGFLKQKQRRLASAEKRYQATFNHFPFVKDIAALAESRRLMNWSDPREAADMLARASDQIKEINKNKALIAEWILIESEVGAALDDWYHFYHLYDPGFDWWMDAPYDQFKKMLLQLRDLRSKESEEPGLDGIRIGEAELSAQLSAEMIPYTPKELIKIGQKELDWCVTEMKKLAMQLGYGNDLKKVLDHVKNKAVPPGGQPESIRKMAWEAIDFLEKNDLLTIPEMAKKDWHIDMLSARQQLMNPFFTGGDNITLSYPTSTMTHERKLMSMRGNNPHFCWATVHHELIPGHHLQFYMAARYNTHRSLFDTPFYVEGWPLYWEMKLWDMNFVRCIDDRVGMLFWRMHRCARIVFSLSYHLGLMNAEQCVDLLVNTVGHELENARAEVRRSFAGWYPPLYQCAYLLGGLQLRALADEVVKKGKMTLKEFHDAVLRENTMPIALLRAKLLDFPINRPFVNDWRFYKEDR